MYVTFIPLAHPRYTKVITMDVTRILLVDDECLVRKILTQILATYPDMEVIGEAASGDEAISCVETLQPHIVIMDIRMPRMDGIAAAREIKHRYPHVRIIGLSEYAHGYHADAMEKAGAIGVYQKSKATEELYTAIKKVGGQNSPELWA
jgi:DNA-binding NarL/FixJ family response regulator